MSKRGVVRYWLAVGALAVFAITLRHEAVASGFFADDYAQLGMLTGNYPLHRSKWDLFTFSDGSREEGERLIRSGFFPWFVEPTLRLSLFRPLASGMIWLDFQLFGREPLGYHVHSVIAWCVLFGVLALLYSQLMPAGPALVALALFAVDEAHGVILAWIANRSAIVCTMLAILGFLFYRRRREREGVFPAWAVLLCYTLSFGFGEYALCMLGYVVAYEWLMRRDELRARVRHLWPIAVPTVLYLAVRGTFKYTPHGSGIYVDPTSEPQAFAMALLERVPVLAADMLLGLRGEYWTFGFEPWIYRWLGPREASSNWFAWFAAWRLTHVVLGVVACVLFGLITRWLWRFSANVHVRWLAVGSALSVLPVVGSFPSSRLLLVPLIGFCPLIATLLYSGLSRARLLLGSGSHVRAVALIALALAACAYLSVLGIWLTRDEMASVRLGRRARDAVLNLEADERLPHQHIVMLSAAGGDTSTYVPLTRWLYRASVPLSCSTLSTVPAAYSLRRIAEHAFTIEYFKPATILRTTPEQLLRGPQHPLRVNDVINTGLFRVMVLSLRDGLPYRLLVRFEWPLEHPALRFMSATRDGIRVFPMPPVGGVTVVPAPAPP